MEVNNEIKFSIIMASYNRAFCIQNAINSILNQTTQNFELIIVDDGSTDETEQLINKLYKKQLISEQIRYFKNKKNKGASTSRNIGLSKAKYDWIGYLDTDNVITTDFIETFTNYIKNNPTNNIFYCKEISESEDEKLVIGHAFDFQELCTANYIDLGCFVHNKNCIKKYGNFNTKINRLIDWELIIRYTYNEKPIFIDKILLEYNNKNTHKRITNSEDLKKAVKQVNKTILNLNCSFIDKIFSIKTSISGKYKIFRFLGFTVKTKNKSKNN